MTVDVIIPTCNPDEKLQLLLGNLEHQTVPPNKVFIMNTITEKCNVDVFNATYKTSEKIEIRHIERKEFDHATTRNDGARLSEADYLLFFTQDAIPADNHLSENLLQHMDENVVVAFGRQIADESNPIEYLSRNFNYPTSSHIKSEKDKKQMGIKVIFCSNVCALYKRETFWELDGFNDHNIFNEDMLFAYKVIKSGYSIAYEADAVVRHSHNYDCKKIFHRFFDQGVSQKENEQLFKEFSSMGEGGRQAKYIIAALWKKYDVKNIARFVVQSIFKVSGYLLGKHFRWLPNSLCRRLCLNKAYFSGTKTE